MTPKKIALGVLATVLVGVGVWFLIPGSESQPKDAATESPSKGNDTVALLKKARAAQGTRTVSPASIAGTVRAEDGAPLPGATVLIKNREGLNAFDMGGEGTPPTATTDEEGRWSFDSVSPGKMRVTASAEGHLPEDPLDLYLSSEEKREGVEIVLKPGGHTLSGTITDVGGGPVSFAVIVILRSAGFDNKAHSVATTDDEGHYQVQLTSGAYSLEVSHPDYVKKEETITLASDRTFDMSLAPAAAVHGSVVTRDGEPVPDAKVYAMGGVNRRSNWDKSGGGQANADEKGEFVMTGLTSGTYTLRALAKGYATTEPTEIELGIAESLTGIEIVVDPAHTISGFVVEDDDRTKGIEGVQVMAMNMRAQTFAFAFHPTGDDGYFEMPALPGTYMVMAYHEDLLGSFMETSVTVVDEDIDDVLIALKRGAVLRGRVDPPMVADIGLEVEEMGFGNMMKAMMAQAAKTRSDEEGNFEMRPAPSGDFLLVANAKDGRKGQTSLSINQPTHEDLVITLADGRAISGQVVDQKGKPVLAVRVEVHVKTENKAQAMIRMANQGQSGFPVNEKGEYQIRGLEEGTYEIVVLDSRGKLSWADESDSKIHEPKEVDIRGRDITDHTLEVQRADGIISGVVLGVDGVPLVDAWVSASRADPKFASMLQAKAKAKAKAKEEDMEGMEEILGDDYDAYAWGEKEEAVLTDEEGRFTLNNLRDGVYQVTANAPTGSARAKEKNVKPGDSITLKLEEMQDLRVVVTANGAPVTSYTVAVSGPAMRTHQVTSEVGQHVFTRLERGTYTVTASNEISSATEKVEVGTQAEANVALELKPWCGISGTVVDVHSREPVSGLIVWTIGSGADTEMGERSMDMMTGKGPRTDETGQFSVERLFCESGAVTFMSPESIFGGGGQPGAYASYELESGSKDLGKIYYLSKPAAPDDKRGTYMLDIEYDQESEESRVASVIPNSAAEAAGIANGDLVVSVDGISAKEFGSLVGQLTSGPSVHIGDKVVLTIAKASGETQDVSLTAVAMPVSPQDTP